MFVLNKNLSRAGNKINAILIVTHIPINEYELVANNERCIFSIQPLTSMYQYYLVNDDTGDMWKFQWSTKGDDYRWIERFM